EARATASRPPDPCWASSPYDSRRRLRVSSSIGAGVENLGEEIQVLPRDGRPGVLRRPRQAALAQLLAARGAIQKIAQRVAPSHFVPFADNQARLSDDVRNLAAIRADDGHGARKRFDQHSPELFAPLR